MRTSLQHDHRLGHLAHPLAAVHKMRDPHARRMVLSHAGYAGVTDRDSHDAGELADARRALGLSPQALGMLPPGLRIPARPAPDDLVERMAAALVRAVRVDRLALDATGAVLAALGEAGFTPRELRPDLVTPAVARARARLRRAARLDRAADIAAFGTLLLAWLAFYCLTCPPAHAAAHAALVTDERLYGIATWAPVAIAVLLVLAVCFRERGMPLVGDEAADPSAPVVAPGLDDRRRAADRG